MTVNAFCHVEWVVTDLDRAKAFLGGLFSWTFEDLGEGYSLFRTSEGPGGGLEKADAVTPAVASPQVYVHVADIDATAARAKELGGGVAIERTEIPGIGWHARITDPDGNPIGLWQGLS
jgi:predicted enzyme related to lactoylglutathione lyase